MSDDYCTVVRTIWKPVFMPVDQMLILLMSSIACLIGQMWFNGHQARQFIDINLFHVRTDTPTNQSFIGNVSFLSKATHGS